MPVLAALLFLAFAPRGPLPEVTVGPPPEWVDELPLPRGPARAADDARDGVSVLLSDAQVLVGGPHELEFSVRFAERIVSRAGVDGSSRVTVDFDPEYETLEFHAVRVHRDGAVLDVLDPADIQVLQRETELESGIVDGSVTATILLRDVRVGDVVEQSYTVRGMNPIFGGRYADSFWVAGPHAYGLLRVRVLMPADRHLAVRRYDTDLEPAVRREGDRVVREWIARDTPAVLPDSDLPYWYEPYPWIQLSEYRDWGEVARWGAGHFERAAASSAGVSELAATFAASSPDPRVQVVEALRFVQDEIRYLGLEMGAHSHEPHAPEEVLLRRFGDCKDKSLLLVTLLRELGVEAAPALVDHATGPRVAERLPSPLVFDHAVVRAEVAGEVWWMDPTREFEGGRVPGLPYDTAGLVLRPGTTDVEPAPRLRTDGPLLRVHYAFEAPDADGVAALTVTTHATARSASVIRGYFAGASREEVRTDYLDYYSDEFPGIRSVRAPTLRDDRDADEVVVVERYAIDGLWDDGEPASARFRPLEIRDRLHAPDTIQRAMPIGLEHPEHVAVRMDVALPADADLDDETSFVDDAAFLMRFERRVDATDRVHLEWEYETRGDAVPVDRAEEYLDHLDEAWGLLGEHVSVGGEEPVRIAPRRIPRELLLGVWLLAAVVGLVRLTPFILQRTAHRALLRGDMDRAIRLAHASVQACLPVISPPRAAFLAWMSVLEADAGREQDAEAHALEALRLTATQTSRRAHRAHGNALRAIAILRVRQERYADALDALDRAQDAERSLPVPKPRAVLARRVQRVEILARLGRTDGLAAELDDIESRSDGDRIVLHEVLAARAVLAEAEGDVEEARRLHALLVARCEEVFGPEHNVTRNARELERRAGARTAGDVDGDATPPG